MLLQKTHGGNSFQPFSAASSLLFFKCSCRTPLSWRLISTVRDLPLFGGPNLPAPTVLLTSINLLSKLMSCHCRPKASPNRTPVLAKVKKRGYHAGNFSLIVVKKTVSSSAVSGITFAPGGVVLFRSFPSFWAGLAARTPSSIALLRITRRVACTRRMELTESPFFFSSATNSITAGLLIDLRGNVPSDGRM